MQIVLETLLSFLYFATLLNCFSGVDCSSGGDRKKRRDKPRSQSLGDTPRSSKGSDKSRTISIVNVDMSDWSPKPIKREGSDGSLNEAPPRNDGKSRLRPNVGAFDDLNCRFHVMAPLNPTHNTEIADYSSLFPGSPTPIDLDRGRREMKKNRSDSKKRGSDSSTSSSSSSSSYSTSSSSDD